MTRGVLQIGPCKVPGCARPPRAHGLCNAHWMRLRRHGDPTAGGTPIGEPLRFLEEVVFTFAGDDCLVWPYSRISTGYPTVVINGELVLVHRAACEYRNGPPPSPTHQAAHACGRGQQGCCNPNHLSWKTAVENSLDRVAHGTDHRGEKHPGAKLSDHDVVVIRQAKGKATQKEVADQFGVTTSCVSHIQRGAHRTW